MLRIPWGASAFRLLGRTTGASALALALGSWSALKPSAVWAQSGGQPGQFLDYGAGARALAMGGAFYAIADDATATYWNPAGLPQLQQKELAAMQANLFQDTQLQFVSLAWPTATGGTFAFGITQLSSTGFEKIAVTANPNDPTNISVTNLGTFADTERAFSASWGRYLTENLSVGLTGNYITRTLDTSSDTSQSIDVASMYRYGPYRIAVGIENLAAHTSGDTSDTLPLILKAGNALVLFKNRLLIDFDIEKNVNADPEWRFGGEYWLLDWWALRVGINGQPSLLETDFGFGLKWRWINFDVAEGIQTLGTTTRFSMSARFGQSIAEKHDAEVKSIITEGLMALQAGDFPRAAERLQAAADADPGNQQVRRILSRLEAATAFIPQAVGADEVSEFTRRGVIAYVDGRDLRTAVNALRYAYNKSPKDDKLLGALNQAEKEAGVSDLTHKPEGPEVFTFVDQKIYDARQAIYEGKYDLALRRCTDVLDLEPKNETALEIMGSAFYLMDQRDKARDVWQHALEINPDNKVVGEFLKKVQP